MREGHYNILADPHHLITKNQKLIQRWVSHQFAADTDLEWYDRIKEKVIPHIKNDFDRYYNAYELGQGEKAEAYQTRLASINTRRGTMEKGQGRRLPSSSSSVARVSREKMGEETEEDTD